MKTDLIADGQPEQRTTYTAAVVMCLYLTGSHLFLYIQTHYTYYTYVLILMYIHTYGNKCISSDI